MQKVFEHTIDVSRYLERGLTPEMLWAGLEDFARNPHDYVETIEESSVLDAASDDGRKRLARTLHFTGGLEIQDVVELVQGKRLTTLIAASGQFPESRLDIEVHSEKSAAANPAERTLAVTFAYFEAPRNDKDFTEALQTLRTKAWVAKDQGVIEEIVRALDV